MEIRIYTTSGSVDSFFQDSPAQIAGILKSIQSTMVFASQIITIAGDYSLTTLVPAQIDRIDFISEDIPPWKRPPDVLDVVEMSEDEYRERSHLNDPSQLERRNIPKQTGESTVVFVEVETTGGNRIFPAERW